MENASNVERKRIGILITNLGTPDSPTKNGLKKYLSNSDLNFSYRSSNLSDEDIVISSTFLLEYGEKNEIHSKMEKIKLFRK